MPQITVSPKPNKKKSTFEKLWAQANALKQSNQRLERELNAIVERMQETVIPEELKLVEAQVPLVKKLLDLGQRKSMTKWERQTLDSWILELVDDMHHCSLINDELKDCIARYDAFRMGIELEDSDLPPHQQFIEIIRAAEDEARQAHEQQQKAHSESREQRREQMIKLANISIAQTLDHTLGPRPTLEETPVDDLFESELNEQLKIQQAKYDIDRAELHAQLTKDALDEIDRLLSEDEKSYQFEDLNTDEFDDLLDELLEEPMWNEIDEENDSDFVSQKNNPALTNDAFQQLFRATAAKLHPDREPNTELRLEKQQLMVKLLKARKQGDLITVLELYETWVGEHTGFNKTDQRALTQTVRQWLENLDDEKDDIIMRTPLHSRAYHQFHNKSKRKVDTTFEQYLRSLEKQQTATNKCSEQIRSLATLKPWLEERYDRSYDFFTNSFL